MLICFPHTTACWVSSTLFVYLLLKCASSIVSNRLSQGGQRPFQWQLSKVSRCSGFSTLLSDLSVSFHPSLIQIYRLVFLGQAGLSSVLDWPSYLTSSKHSLLLNHTCDAQRPKWKISDRLILYSEPPHPNAYLCIHRSQANFNLKTEQQCGNEKLLFPSYTGSSYWSFKATTKHEHYHPELNKRNILNIILMDFSINTYDDKDNRYNNNCREISN